jgi:hypothetical protein
VDIYIIISRDASTERLKTNEIAILVHFFPPRQDARRPWRFLVVMKYIERPHFDKLFHFFENVQLPKRGGFAREASPSPTGGPITVERNQSIQTWVQQRAGHRHSPSILYQPFRIEINGGRDEDNEMSSDESRSTISMRISGASQPSGCREIYAWYENDGA